MQNRSALLACSRSCSEKSSRGISAHGPCIKARAVPERRSQDAAGQAGREAGDGRRILVVWSGREAAPVCLRVYVGDAVPPHGSNRQPVASLLRLQPKIAPIRWEIVRLDGILVIIKPGFEVLTEVEGRGVLASEARTLQEGPGALHGGPILRVAGVGWHPAPSAPPRTSQPHGSACVQAASLGRSTSLAHQRATRAWQDQRRPL